MGNEQTLEDTGFPPRMNPLWARSMLSIREEAPARCSVCSQDSNGRGELDTNPYYSEN